MSKSNRDRKLKERHLRREHDKSDFARECKTMFGLDGSEVARESYRNDFKKFSKLVFGVDIPTKTLEFLSKIKH